jgi:hypothetical protein
MFHPIVLIIACASLLVGFGGCRKDRTETLLYDDLSHAYFPLEKGMYHLYAYQHITFNRFSGKSDTLNIQVKDIQEDTFIDNSGRIANRIFRVYINPVSQQEDSIRVFYYVKDKGHVEMNFNNQRVVKMSFPVNTHYVWDIHSLNKNPRFMVHYAPPLEQFTLKGVAYPDCVVIKDIGPSGSTSIRNITEIYSRNMGLIWREFANVETINNVMSGVKESYELLSHGKI